MKKYEELLDEAQAVEAALSWSRAETLFISSRSGVGGYDCSMAESFSSESDEVPSSTALVRRGRLCIRASAELCETESLLDCSPFCEDISISWQ